ncbi:MAG: FtsX-like permease family protein [Acidimicrobiales bacterium]
MFRTTRLLNLRRLRRQPVRAIISVIAVAAGVALAIAVLVLSTSTSASLRDFGRRLSGPTALRVVGATSRGGLDATVLATVEKTPGVAAAVPIVQAVTYIADASGNATTVVALGVDCHIQALIGSIGCDQAALTKTPDTAPPLISASLARRLGPSATIRTDLGRRPLRGATTIDRLDTLNSGNVVVYALPVAQRLFVRPGRLDAIYVQPAAGVNVAALRATLQRAVGPWNGVLTASDPPPGSGVVTASFVPLFGLLAFFLMGVAGVLVFNTMSLSLEDRRRDLAVIGALGSRTRTLVGGVVAEAAALGCIGGLLGTGAGILLAHPLTSSLSDFTKKFAGVPITVHATLSALVVGVLIGTLLGALAAWVPARRATRMDVAAELSMRDIRLESAPAARLRRVAVYAVVAAIGVGICWLAQRHGAIEQWQAGIGPFGLIVASVGTLMTMGAAAALVARLAQRFVARSDGATRLGVANLIRDPGRTGVMAVAIGAVVAIAFMVASTHVSIRDAIAHGVRTGSHNEIVVSTLAPNNSINIDAKPSADLARRLARIPGVAALETNATLLTGHTMAGLIGVSAYQRPVFTLSIVEGPPGATVFAQGKVLIGVGLARDKGLRPGSPLQLDTPTGQHTVTVGGVWLNGNYNGHVVDMPLPLFRQLYGDQPTESLGVLPAPGVDVQDLANRIRAAHLDPDLIVDTPSQVVNRASHDIGRQLKTFNALLRAMLFMAFIAVLSTLLLVGAQRRRELGLLAAVGMEPRQLARMTITEALTVGIIGVLLSVIGAVVMNIAFTLLVPIIVGYKDPIRFAFSSMAIWGAVALVVVVAAAALPAWRTSRVEVLEALQYE